MCGLALHLNRSLSSHAMTAVVHIQLHTLDETGMTSLASWDPPPLLT